MPILGPQGGQQPAVRPEAFMRIIAYLRFLSGALPCEQAVPLFPSYTKEALNKSARAVGEGFCSKSRFGNRRNTLCISRFSNRRVGAKDPLPAAADLFRASLGMPDNFNWNLMVTKIIFIDLVFK